MRPNNRYPNQRDYYDSRDVYDTYRQNNRRPMDYDPYFEESRRWYDPDIEHTGHYGRHDFNERERRHPENRERFYPGDPSHRGPQGYPRNPQNYRPDPYYDRPPNTRNDYNEDWKEQEDEYNYHNPGSEIKYG